MAKKNFKKYYQTNGTIDDNAWNEIAPKSRRWLLLILFILLGGAIFICYKWSNSILSYLISIAIILFCYKLLTKKLDNAFTNDMKEQLNRKIKTSTATFETFFTDTEVVTRLNPKNIINRATYDKIRTIFETKNYIICSLKDGKLIFTNKKQLNSEQQKEIMKFVLNKVKYAELENFKNRF